jgi:hypothetical protein
MTFINHYAHTIAWHRIDQYHVLLLDWGDNVLLARQSLILARFPP